MDIPSNYYIVVDIIVVAIFALCIIFSYKNGILYELLSMFFIVISLFLGYFFAPLVAKRLYLVTSELETNPLINKDMIYYTINVIIWFVILSIVFILLFLLIKPIFKKVTKIPVVGWVDKLFGIIFGFIKAIIVCSLLSCLLNTTIVNNGKEVKENTLIKYVDNLSSKVVSIVVKNIDYSVIGENISDIDIENTRKVFEQWLIEQGFINDKA